MEYEIAEESWLFHDSNNPSLDHASRPVPARAGPRRQPNAQPIIEEAEPA